MKRYYHFEFNSNQKIKQPRLLRIIANMILSFIILLLLVLTVTPWQQTSKGYGTVVAIDPNDRIQKIHTPISGRIKKWYVNDGDFIKKGDVIVELEDVDPLFLERLINDRRVAYNKLEAIKVASETANINYQRQTDLFNKGLSSRKAVESAKIKYKKLLSEEASAASKLLSVETKLSRQLTQKIIAPSDGNIVNIQHGSGNIVVSEGEALAVFVPLDVSHAVEIFVDGNDLPLITKSRKVRLQFEGWPAVQISGWPSIAIGTFGGVVKTIDTSMNKNGKFRVIITPDSNELWPDNKYLRQGTSVYGWIILDEVKLGYELWRKFNGLPAEMYNDDLVNFVKLKKKKEKKEK